MIRKEKISLSLIIIFSLLHLVWLFVLPLLPFVDLPFHLAEAEVFKNFNNPDYLFSTYFSIPSTIKSNSIYIYFCSLNIFPNVEIANKLFYTIYIILFPFSVWSIIKTFNGNSYYSILSFLFLINHNVHWGFVSYMMSLPVIVFIFISFYNYFVLNKSKYLYFLWALFILVFFLHFQMAIFIVLIFSVLTIIYQRNSLKKIILNIVSVFPVMIVMIYAYSIDNQSSTTPLFTYMLSYYTSSYFNTFFDRFNVLFVVDNYFILRGIPGVIFSLFATIPLILIFIAKISIFSKSKVFKNQYLKYLFILITITFLCFFILPDVIPGQNIIFERYSVLFFLLIIIISSIIQINIKLENIIAILIPFIVLLHTLFISDYMFEFKNDTSEFTTDIFPDSSKSRLAGVILDNDFRGSKVYAHFPMYFTVWKKGITTGLIDYRFGLIKRNVSRDILPQYIEWTEKQINYDDYYEPVDYLLIKSESTPTYKNFIKIEESGQWQLYISNSNHK